MRALDSSELDCLREIAAGMSDLLPPCGRDVLRRLERLGLVEQAPGLWLPLEMKRGTYRLTAAGREVLGAA